MITFLVAWIASAGAADLERLRVYVGEGHARILLVTTSTLPPTTSRAAPPVGTVPARGIVVMHGIGVAEDLPTITPVDAGGVRRVAVSDLGGSVQITADLDEGRTVTARPLGRRAYVVDLRVGTATDPTLPDDAALLGLVDGRPDQATPTGPRPPRIVLDPGHGGFEHGARGVTGSREADLALQISRRTRDALVERLGATVTMTRDADVAVSLTERGRIAKESGADLFLSIHCNAAPSPALWGIETYSVDTASDAGAARVAARENALAGQLEADDPTLLSKLVVAGTNALSRDLAAEVQTGVVRDLRAVYGDDQIRDLGAKTALFYVLVRTGMPSVLFEASFVSNPHDERRLRTPHFQMEIARALAAAVERWWERQQ